MLSSTIEPTQAGACELPHMKPPEGPPATLADEIRAGLDIRAIGLEDQHTPILSSAALAQRLGPECVGPQAHRPAAVANADHRLPGYRARGSAGSQNVPEAGE